MSADFFLKSTCLIASLINIPCGDQSFQYCAAFVIIGSDWTFFVHSLRTWSNFAGCLIVCLWRFHSIYWSFKNYFTIFEKLCREKFSHILIFLYNWTRCGKAVKAHLQNTINFKSPLSISIVRFYDALFPTRYFSDSLWNTQVNIHFFHLQKVIYGEI